MVVNLVANARDAMPTGGSLTIKAGSYGAEDSMVRLEVSDTGMGMTPDVRARIFEPFFTTKAPGKGTGLGLPSLKAMVEEAGGRVEVVSDLGAGSTFVISLPRLEAVSLR
jgi:signal transduction histidine kinase